jgi:hypothetical protein
MASSTYVFLREARPLKLRKTEWKALTATFPPQLCFVAYPIVFTEIRGWSSSNTGLAFLGIGVGCLITISLEPVCRRIINSHPLDPETGKPYPEAMVSIVCVAAILIPTGEIIFAWTCTPNVHWIFPILAGVSVSFPSPTSPQPKRTPTPI